MQDLLHNHIQRLEELELVHHRNLYSRLLHASTQNDTLTHHLEFHGVMAGGFLNLLMKMFGVKQLHFKAAINELKSLKDTSRIFGVTAVSGFK